MTVVLIFNMHLYDNLGSRFGNIFKPDEYTAARDLVCKQRIGHINGLTYSKRGIPVQSAVIGKVKTGLRFSRRMILVVAVVKAY